MQVGGIKENIRVDGERDIQTKVMTTLFALFAEVERDLISERTREGLARARSSGRKLGRPKGSLGVSRLDGKENEGSAFSTPAVVDRLTRAAGISERSRVPRRRARAAPLLRLHDQMRRPSVQVGSGVNLHEFELVGA